MNARSLVSSLWFRRWVWVLAAWLLVWALAWAAVPPLALRTAQSRLSDLLGRQVTVGSVEFAPWSLEITVHDVAVATADGRGVQFAVERLYVDAEAQSLLRWAPVIDAVTVEAPTLQLTHLGGGHYDIDDIVQRLRPPDGTPDTPLPRFALYNLALQGGRVDFTDRAAGAERQHTVRELQVSLPFLSSLDSQREVLVAPHLAFVLNGSRFDSQAQGTPFAASRKADVALQVSQLDLAPYLPYLPYLPAALPVRLQSAVVDADLRLAFVQSPETAVTLSGALTVSGLAVQDAQGKPLVSADRLQVDIADLRPLERRAKLSGVSLSTLLVHVARDTHGQLNLPGAGPVATGSALPAPGAPVPPSPGWAVQLDTVAVHDGGLEWTDGTTAPVTRLALHDWQLTATDVKWPMRQPATLRTTARLHPRGAGAQTPAAQLSLQGAGTLDAGQAEVRVSDLGLGMLAGYVAAYLDPSLRGWADAHLSLGWDGARTTAQMHALSLRDVALVDKAAPAPVAPGAARRNAGPSATDLPQFKRLEVRDAHIDTVARTATVGQIVLQQPRTGVRREADGHWMLERWLSPATAAHGGVAVSPKPAGAPPDRPPSPPPWKVQVGAFTLDGGQVVFADHVPARPVQLALRDLHVAAHNLRSDGSAPSRVQVAAKVASGHVGAGSVRFAGNVVGVPLAVAGDLELVDLPAHALAAYVDSGLRVDVVRADASFKGRVRYSALPQGPELSLQGDAALEDFRAQTIDPDAQTVGQDLLRWKALNVPGIDLRVAPGAATRVQVREAVLSDFFAQLVVSPQGRVNLQDLGTSSSPSGDASSPAHGEQPVAPAAALAPVIQMGPVSMVNGRVLFSDRFIRPNYTANLSELSGKLGGFSNQATQGVVPLADLELRGRAQGTASLEIQGKLNPLAQPLALDIQGRVRDLELPPLSAYAVKYAGYGIERGKLSVDVHYAVQPDGQLVATNKLVLNQLSFGDKVEGAPASLPVKLAVALLADRHGVIDVDLPISGSLSDPQFRLGAVIWKVVTNLVAKALTAPFSLLASALGDNAVGVDLGSVAFAPGSAALGDAARAGLDTVAQVLRDRPTLRVTLVGTAHLEAEQAAVKREKLSALLVAEKRRVASGQGRDPASITAYSPAEMPALLRSVYRRADIAKPRNMLGLAQELPVADMEALLLDSLSATEDDVAALALQRAVVVKEYLASKQLAAERLFLGAVKTGGAAADAKPQTELEVSGD